MAFDSDLDADLAAFVIVFVASVSLTCHQPLGIRCRLFE
jgi:hypothetical protein